MLVFLLVHPVSPLPIIEGQFFFFFLIKMLFLKRLYNDMPLVQLSHWKISSSPSPTRTKFFNQKWSPSNSLNMCFTVLHNSNSFPRYIKRRGGLLDFYKTSYMAMTFIFKLMHLRFGILNKILSLFEISIKY